MKLTKADKAKVQDHIDQIYAGAVMSLSDPVSDEYRRLSARLSLELKELKNTLGMN